MSITLKFFDNVVSVALWNTKFGTLNNHANERHVAITNLMKAFVISESWVSAQYVCIEAGLLIGEAAPVVAGTLCYAGNMSWIWLTPLALAILVSVRGIGDLFARGDAAISDQYAWFEDRVIRRLPGSSLLIQGMLFATNQMASVAITVSACAVAYFVGGYIAMAFAAYTVLNTLCKVQLLTQSLQHRTNYITQGLYGITLILNGDSTLAMYYGLMMLSATVNAANTKLFKIVEITKIHDLEPHPQKNLINVDLTDIEVDRTHIRPPPLPKSIGNIKLHETNFEKQIKILWGEMENSLEKDIVTKEISSEQDTYDKWVETQEDTGDTFKLQKKFLREGRDRYIQYFARKRLSGDSHQEDLATAAVAAVAIAEDEQAKLGKHGLMTMLGIGGHFCPVRRGAVIDALVAGHLSESAYALPPKIESVLRNKRSELFQVLFIGKLLRENKATFGPGGPYDLSCVHYHHDFLYVAGQDLGLNEHWGALNQVKCCGYHMARAIQISYKKTKCAKTAKTAFFEAYSRDLILTTIQESIASESSGTLKFDEVEQWFIEWLIEKEIVKLEGADIKEIERIKKQIFENASKVPSELDKTKDPYEQKKTALANLIQPGHAAKDRLFVEALALAYYQKEENPNYEQAYLNAKAKVYFRKDAMTSDYTLKENWIATMLAEMGFLKTCQADTIGV